MKISREINYVHMFFNVGIMGMSVRIVVIKSGQILWRLYVFSRLLLIAALS